jgi:uncharacterized membrane protein (DUF4010 family)
MVDLSQGSSELDLNVAKRAIVIAGMANTLFKGGFALSTGSDKLRQALLPGLGLMLTAGILVAFVF